MLENVRQRDKGQLRPLCRTESAGKHDGKDYHAGQQRHQENERNHLHGRRHHILFLCMLRLLLLLGHIAAVGNEDAQAHRQSEETQTDSLKNDLRRDLRKVRFEKEAQPRGATVNKCHMNGHHDEHHKEQRHENLAQALDALAHVEPQHRRCQNNGENSISSHRRGLMPEGVEEVGQRLRIHTGESVLRRLYHIVEAPAGHHKIETGEERHRHHQQPREPLPPVSAAQSTEGAVSALA